VTGPQFNAFETAIADRWLIESEVGRGPRATVYRGHDVETDRMVAIKVLNADIASAIDFPIFQQQLHVAERVRHPSIVPFLEAGEVAGRVFCVAPFVDGESLRTRLKRERQLPLPEALAITRQVAGALGFAHEHGFLHKDVKPENIFVTGTGALLTDLGLSRAITRSIDEMKTGTGLTLGTPEYMSPEHARGGVEIDARADLYSLGCVFYEMLAGEPPFTGTAPNKIWMQTLTDTPVPISVHRDALPSDVGATLDRLLSKTPDARFSDAAQLVRTLSTIQESATPLQ
jgi:serine/threonine-protein kinase